jgi:hypothetical protein
VVNLFGNTEFSDSTAIGAPEGAAPDNGAPKDTIGTNVDMNVDEEPVPPAAAAVEAAASPEIAKKKGPQPMSSPELRTFDNFHSREAKFTYGYDTDGDLVNPKEPEDFEKDPLVASPLDPESSNPPNQFLFYWGQLQLIS